MENNKKQEGKNTPSNSRKPDYYTSIGKKIGDFLLGFFGVIISYSFYTFVLNFSYYSANMIWIILFISIVVLVVLPVTFFKMGRRFITIGIISTLLIPLLIFGSCFMIKIG